MVERFAEAPTQTEEEVNLARRDGYREGFADGRAELAETAERWRQSYEVLREVLAQCGSNPDFERLDQILREWTAKA